jgi:phenylacetate-coenzyme A ligase PaaK-like adenylate-forming protein
MPAQAPGVDHLENTNLCPKQQQQQVIKVTPSYHIKLATYLKKTNKKDLI